MLCLTKVKSFKYKVLLAYKILSFQFFLYIIISYFLFCIANKIWVSFYKLSVDLVDYC